MGIRQRLAKLEKRHAMQSGRRVPVIVATHDAGMEKGKEVCGIGGTPIPRLAGEDLNTYKTRAIEGAIADSKASKLSAIILHVSL